MLLVDPGQTGPPRMTDPQPCPGRQLGLWRGDTQ